MLFRSGVRKRAEISTAEGDARKSALSWLSKKKYDVAQWADGRFATVSKGGKRKGIASFPTLPGLRRYLDERDADLRGYVLVELEGELSPDRDLDADEGAILVLAGRVLGVHQPTT